MVDEWSRLEDPARRGILHLARSGTALFAEVKQQHEEWLLPLSDEFWRDPGFKLWQALRRHPRYQQASIAALTALASRKEKLLADGLLADYPPPQNENKHEWWDRLALSVGSPGQWLDRKREAASQILLDIGDPIRASCST